ncbi:hypothetical protein GCM10027290_28170 [Micromonospora sonneratiae]
MTGNSTAFQRRRRTQWSVVPLLVIVIWAAWTPGVARASAPTGQRCTSPATEQFREVPWTNQRLAPQRVWDLTRGSGVVVAVIDSGVDTNVPQLRGAVLPGVDVVNGGGRADSDCFGHGTFVAGIIAARPARDTGVVGIAPAVRILPIRQANDANDGNAAGMARGIRAAVDAGAKVINISASSFFPTVDLRTAVEYAAAKDVLIVAAASNEAEEGNPKAYPAAYPQVLAVGAIGPDGSRSGFSEFGNYLDLVAPGVDVISLSRGGRGHVMDRGTSYAAPFVAGVAALVRSYHPKLSAGQVKRRLEQTADHPAATLPSLELGWGVVNPYAAVTSILPGEGSTVTTAGGRSDPIDPPPVRAADPTPVRNAALFTAVLVALGGALLLFGAAVPRGVRRRWRPASAPDPDPPGTAGTTTAEKRTTKTTTTEPTGRAAAGTNVDTEGREES